jgi:hypothetical protein
MKLMCPEISPGRFSNSHAGEQFLLHRAIRTSSDDWAVSCTNEFGIRLTGKFPELEGEATGERGV